MECRLRDCLQDGQPEAREILEPFGGGILFRLGHLVLVVSEPCCESCSVLSFLLFNMLLAGLPLNWTSLERGAVDKVKFYQQFPEMQSKVLCSN